MRETLPESGLCHLQESITVLAFSFIKSERLLVKITEKMEGFNANVCAFDAALQEAPKVLNPVRVNLTVNVLFRVVNHLVNLISVKAAITFPAIGEQFRALHYMLSHFAV